MTRAIGSLLSTVALSTFAAAAVVGGSGMRPVEAQQTARSQAVPVAQETGQFSSSGTIIWLRVDEDGSVLVFAARGYRSAFAHPSVLTPAETEAWAAAIETFLKADSAAARAASETNGRNASSSTAGVHRAFGEGDITLDQRQLGQAEGLVLRVGVNSAAPVTASFAALALPSVLPVLRSTAQVAKRNASAHEAQLAAAAAAAATASAQSGGAPATAAPAATPVSLNVPPTAAASPASAAKGTTPFKSAPAAPLITKAPHRDSIPTPAPKATIATEPVKLPIGDASPSASAQIGRVVEPPDSHIEYNAALSAHQAAAAPGAADSAAAPNAPPHGATAGHEPSARSGDARMAVTSTSGDSIAEKALSTEGRLPPSVLGDIVRQRQQLLQYCYTEFGLRSDAALAGQIVVRLVIQQDGTVSQVSVPHHNWTGHGADKVEACIRDRVSHWQFPAAQLASTHEIQLIFGR